MRRLSIAILTALPPLLLLAPLRAEAGVALLDTVSSCPSVIKNAITAEMLLSEQFVPWDAVGTEKVDTVDTTGTVVVIDRIDIIDAINVIDKAIDTVNTINTAVTGGDDKDIDRMPSDKRKKIKFGRRAAFNHSQVSNVLIRIYRHDGDGFICYEYRNKAGFGIGFEVAGVVDWALSDALVLNVSPGVIFRKPINTAVVGTSEVGLSIPVLAEWGPFGGVAVRSARGAPDAFMNPWGGMYFLRRLRLFGGICVGVPVYSWVKWNGEENAPFKNRAAADFGLAGGVGLYVSDRAFVDVRGIFGLSGYDGVEGRRLNQLAIGVNYVK
ncbi:MAG: hypothetical protein LBB74_04270 [Chitinispirillales bacterium]|jgi:hypothetical protein|nr:hypothetical protein [Chitinispirillales bacterium]